MEIRFRSGSRVKANPEDVYAELERVRQLGNGDLSLQTLVDESKPKGAPLHDEFDWNNPRAANKWRLHQARRVVQSIVIESTPEVRAYESVTVNLAGPDEKPKPARVFRSIEEILSDPESRDELLGQAIRDALAYRRRYQGLQELAKVFSALDEVLMEVAV